MVAWFDCLECCMDLNQDLYCDECGVQWHRNDFLTEGMCGCGSTKNPQLTDILLIGTKGLTVHITGTACEKCLESKSGSEILRESEAAQELFKAGMREISYQEAVREVEKINIAMEAA